MSWSSPSLMARCRHELARRRWVYRCLVVGVIGIAAWAVGSLVSSVEAERRRWGDSVAIAVALDDIAPGTPLAEEVDGVASHRGEGLGDANPTCSGLAATARQRGRHVGHRGIQVDDVNVFGGGRYFPGAGDGHSGDRVGQSFGVPEFPVGGAVLDSREALPEPVGEVGRVDE